MAKMVAWQRMQQLFVYLEGSFSALTMIASFFAFIFTLGFAFGRRSKRSFVWAAMFLVLSIAIFFMRSFNVTF
ncbi:MAG: hypothetical protein K1X79_07840 [Oligoflexia bacterium]|nr:hypothetical protein [Oligoflexia bacterium]